jgi:hypothetical protein
MSKRNLQLPEMIAAAAARTGTTRLPVSCPAVHLHVLDRVLGFAALSMLITVGMSGALCHMSDIGGLRDD